LVEKPEDMRLLGRQMEDGRIKIGRDFDCKKENVVKWIHLAKVRN
jgi:hypothetical protein